MEQYSAKNIKIIRRDTIDFSSVDISKEGFTKNLNLASNWARDFSGKFLINNLPENLKYKIYNGVLNKKYMIDGEVQIEDVIYNGENVFIAEEVVSILWRDGFVPVWINVSVEAPDKNYTIISLHCGGRFSNKPELMYHVNEGLAPFHVLGSTIPPGWNSLEKDNKFSLTDKKHH